MRKQVKKEIKFRSFIHGKRMSVKEYGEFIKRTEEQLEQYKRLGSYYSLKGSNAEKDYINTIEHMEIVIPMFKEVYERVKKRNEDNGFKYF